MKSFGYFKSDIDGTEPIAENFVPKFGILPDKFYLSSPLTVYNQGNNPICCSCVLHDMVAWHLALRGDTFKKSLSYFYDNVASNNPSGMQPKRGLEFCVNELQFKQYAKISNAEILKWSIMMNGPVLIGLPVYSDYEHFWKGNSLVGGHAVALIGFDNKAFRLKNSWGVDWGQNGFTNFPFEDFEAILEAWTLIW